MIVNIVELFQQLLNVSSTTAEVIVSLLILAIVGVVGWGTYVVISKVFCNWTKKTATTLDDNILASVRIVIVMMILILGIKFALSPLSFLQQYDVLPKIFLVAQILLAAYAASRIAIVITEWVISRTPLAGKSNHLLFILKKVIIIICFVIAAIIILNTLELQGALETTLVGFGVGGIAIAFALQNTLSDFFSAFSIYFDHPFEIDDFIVVGDYSGTVKNIGVRSTRIKLLQGEELVISNKELANSSIRNFRKLEKRRIVFTVGVTFDTPLSKLKMIPDMIKEIIRSVDLAELDRVHFVKFDEYCFRFEIVYYVKSANYAVYLDVQQLINYAIAQAFEKEGIKIAFPTNTVYVKK